MAPNVSSPGATNRMVWDEYEQACRIGWTSADDVQFAQSTTEDHTEALREAPNPVAGARIANAS
jgi:hypothetical protein